MPPWTLYLVKPQFNTGFRRDLNPRPYAPLRSELTAEPPRRAYNRVAVMRSSTEACPTLSGVTMCPTLLGVVSRYSFRTSPTVLQTKMAFRPTYLSLHN